VFVISPLEAPKAK